MKYQEHIVFNATRTIEFPLTSVGIQGSQPIMLDIRTEKSYTGDFIAALATKLIRDLQKSDEIKLEIKVPKNWWEHLKLNHAPKWFLKRYPVVFTVSSQTFKYDLELISIPRYETLKSLGAHSPFIRGLIRSKSDIHTYTRFSDREGYAPKGGQP